jgi:uncharacterized protein YegJ (DUF2314 family)
MSDESPSPVCYAKHEEPEMAKAMADAVGSFKYLWRELTWEYRRIVPALGLSAIKAAFKDPGSSSDAVEHMWLTDIEFDGDVVSAILMNSPNKLTSAKEGDVFALSLDQIEDWMYVLDGRVYGGFTIQVIRAGLSHSERRSHDRAWGFDFANSHRVDVVPNWKEKQKKSMFGKLLGRGAPPPGDPDAEHPMSENMASGLAEAIEKDRNGFFEIGPAGLNTLHSLALGGSAACVKALLDAGADPRAKTAKGRTSRELAETMGWPRVVSMLRSEEAKD